jgi:DNA-binding MarR family transcriptional regulator
VGSSSVTGDLARAAYALHAALERELRDVLAELDLTLALADAVWHLDPGREPISRRELAEHLACDPSNVTFLVDRLQARRLVTRSRRGSDRRITALRLTASGREVRERLVATVADSRMFRPLSSSEQRQLVRLLGRCVDASAALAAEAPE